MAKKVAAPKSNDPKENRPGAAEIAAFKEKHGRIVALVTSDDEMCIVREPRLAELEKCIKNINAIPEAGRKPFDLQRSIYPIIRLYEDKGMMEDEKNQLFVYNKLDEVVKFKEGEVKEL